MPALESFPVTDQESLEWKIKTLRNAIAHNWAVLATEGLNSEQRKEPSNED